MPSLRQIAREYQGFDSMPADDEFFAWQHGVYAGDTNVRDVYSDETPELEFPDWTPDPVDREWWEEELAHLESQRLDCLDCPLTLAVLDARIEQAREMLSEQGDTMEAAR